MADDKLLSFTATLLINGHPLFVLSEATDRNVMVAHPDPNLGSLDASHALGSLSTPDEVWDNARDAGLVDFHLTGTPSPTQFYFRHSEGTYRLYIRSGNYLGQAMFKSKYGVPIARPIEDNTPSPWRLIFAHTGQAVVLSDLITDFAIINLECPSTSARLSTNTFGLDEGGYLIARKSAPATSLRLNILEREVDWQSH
ncbi:hypothetical protein EXN22_05135 [Pseudomonas tructae]|uniref:Uncharacterized protein n=1 Tax=Pseudomonas tructae TaxID=2518644 RepID=A0A411MEJ4_9PSED|nr:hypothetical protein [Pseudomonas tructae]QBF25099.1 hypothetical protein EXN22_05135 [Pseudomonas tructae]